MSKRAIIVGLMSVFVFTGILRAQVAARMEAQQGDVKQLAVQGEQRVDLIVDKIRNRLAGASNDLFIRHLKSTEALVRDDWVRASLVMDDTTKPAEDFMQYTEVIAEGLDAEAGRAEEYLAGQRSMNFAFVSRYDKSLQVYQVRLPENWDESREYPVVVYLHGHTPNPVIWYTSLAFGPSAKPAAGDDTQPVIEPHFTIAPWGRENTGYRGAGEVDVFEAIRDFKSRFKFDEDRMYLCGHSMGGFGTWLIGTRTPDLWAAMAIYAGGARGAVKNIGLAGNVSNMPIMFWHGGKDRTVPVSMALSVRDELRMYGNEAEVVIDPEAGHMVSKDAKTPNKLWLLKHRRQRPSEFSFMADTDEHRGAWGITMRREEAVDPMPKFMCRIDGQEVFLMSKGTTGLEVKLGEDGLGLSGEVKVYWNGKEAYAGEVKTVELGDGVPRGWR